MRFGALFLIIFVGFLAAIVNAVSMMLWVHPHGFRQEAEAADALILRMSIIIGIEFVLVAGWSVWFLLAARRDAIRRAESQPT